jgi:hypothetical protein
MPILTKSLIALGLVATFAGPIAGPVSAQPWRGHGPAPHYYHGPPRGGWHGSYGGSNAGAAVAGALLGLGVGVAIGSALAPPPAVVYAAPPPGYYQAPPPVYYGYGY